MKLRPYQVEARNAILGEWRGRRRVLLVLPTGTGKTIVFSAVTEEEVRCGGRVLILAHRGELLDQARDKLMQATGLACSIEKADQSSLLEWERVTVGSVQSMMRYERLERFSRDHFTMIVVDEAHHVLAETYARILEHFDGARVLGVTATPDRGDKKNLGRYFESLAFEYLLPQAIQDGFLCPIVAKTIPLEIDLDEVKQQSGDFQLAGIAHALDPYLEQIADEITKYPTRKLVVFLPLIATSRRFNAMLRDRGVDSVEVNGESPDRTEILQRFDRAGPSVLCNAMLLTEGWDCPTVDAICVLRPTKLRSLYAQMVGRGTRINPGKENLLLLDFLWHSTRHELVHPAHLIAGSDTIADAMTAASVGSGDEQDLRDLQEQAERSVLAERERALARRLEECRSRKGKLVDPLQYAVSVAAEDLVDYEPSFGWEEEDASSAQLEALERAGINPLDVTNRGIASKLLDRLAMRRKAGLATPKQIRLLERKGFIHVGQWSFVSASRMITRLAANYWVVPRDVDLGTYVPEDFNESSDLHLGYSVSSNDQGANASDAQGSRPDGRWLAGF